MSRVSFTEGGAKGGQPLGVGVSEQTKEIRWCICIGGRVVDN